MKFLIAACCLMSAQPVAALALKGRVLDPGGSPLPGAKILIQPLSGAGRAVEVRTSADGVFEVGVMPNGSYFVEASMPGFLSARYHPVVLHFPRETKLVFRLPFRELTEGGVQNQAAMSGELAGQSGPLVGAQICVSQGGVSKKCATTNGLGQYYLDVAPGTYDVIVTMAGATVYKRTLSLTPGEHVDEIVLDPR